MWNSPAEFFAMGGYALYVWGSFGVCALVFLRKKIKYNAPLLSNKSKFFAHMFHPFPCH